MIAIVCYKIYHICNKLCNKIYYICNKMIELGLQKKLK